jgi:predicted methyltransferase
MGVEEVVLAILFSQARAFTPTTISSATSKSERLKADFLDGDRSPDEEIRFAKSILFISIPLRRSEF